VNAAEFKGKKIVKEVEMGKWGLISWIALEMVEKLNLNFKEGNI